MIQHKEQPVKKRKKPEPKGEETQKEADSDDEPIIKRKKPKQAEQPRSRGAKRSAKQRTQPSRDASKVCGDVPSGPCKASGPHKGVCEPVGHAQAWCCAPVWVALRPVLATCRKAGS